ncbi:hypothetical protein [Hephaestia mangrovi]|uniref:hypothetical protein n=1 Tax=Hephaestia mangrovi TaxID=2873268 RepID=UPI001CA731A0|nr:hypothetical protein [Hephaestia mangrovi]MBY8827846.1 hypothetical protein [Hephaestia mangrovi]
MNLLLLIYAMIAGLAGFNAGPSAVARAAVAETGSLAQVAEAPDQVSIAVKALAVRTVARAFAPETARPDVRRIAIIAPRQPIVAMGRAAPERRLE